MKFRDFLNEASELKIVNGRKVITAYKLFRYVNGKLYPLFVSRTEEVPLHKWNVSKVENMENMFFKADFNGDISKWNVSNVKDMSNMFAGSPLEGKEPDWYR